MDQKEIDRIMKEKIDAGRKFTRLIIEDYDSDQELKKPQPPLVKAPVSDVRIKLPKNYEDLPMEKDFVKILYNRKSSRIYTREKMDLLTLSFLIWAQQGVKGIRGNNYATIRTVPSGGARHPFELYPLIMSVEGLEPGLYHYLPLEHELELLEPLNVSDEDVQKKINDTLCGQIWGLKSNVIFYYSIIPYRGEWRYAFDAHRPMMIDAGHITENLYLACSALGLGTCANAAVDPELASEMFGLDGVEEYIFYCANVGTIDEAE